MFRKTYLTLLAAVTLLLLTVAPVYASPSLNLGSTASYTLTGRVKVDQSCTADNPIYAAQACNQFSYGANTAYVSINDDGSCSTRTDPYCSFSPTPVNVTQGGVVLWQNFGSLNHTVTADLTLNGGLPSFNSGLITPHFGGFPFLFAQRGTYHYYDSLHAGITGIVYVNAPPPSPKPTSNAVGLDGTVGWTVVGLSNAQANLNVTHVISISVPTPIPGVSFTPVTESGNFEQSINLSTRVESPSTAASLVKSFSASLLQLLAGSTLATGGPSPIFQTMLSGQANSPDYTEWWVNGPLSNGSPVQILHGWSSVTGSEDLSLGTSIGTRSAWIVSSELSQTLDLTSPNPNNLLNPTTSHSAANLRLLWKFDKSADLLLRNDDAISLTSHSVGPTYIYAPSPCGQYICYSQVSVTVTRDMALTVNLTLLLNSTSLSLPHPNQVSTLMNLLSTLPWMPLGIAGLAAVVAVSLLVWFTRRTRGQTLPAPAPTTSPSPSPTTPN